MSIAGLSWRNRGSLHCVPIAVLLTVLFVSSAASPAAGDGRVSRVHPLGMADQQATYELVKALLTGEGRAVLDEGHNTIIVLDSSGVQEQVAALLAQLQGPLPSVRVEVRIVDRLTGEEASVSTTGQLLLPSPEASGGGAVHFETGRRKSGTSRSASQAVLVVSGGSAVVFVGREIPYQDWFYSYGRRRSFITSEISWREIGSRLSVRPVVIDGGRKIRLQITPEFEYQAGGGKGKKTNRSVASYAGVSTELVVAGGEEVRLAASGDAEEFYERFFAGYDRQRRTRQVDIYLTATVVPPSP